MAMLRAHAFTPFTSTGPLQSRLSRGTFTSLAPQRASGLRTQRGALQVVAAEEVKKKQPIDSAVKRAMIAVERRKYNRARKSACATRIKKVIKLATSMALPKSDEDLKPLETLISEAYQEIDKAVVKGVLHRNNGAHKKARVARYKRQVLMAAGLFKPSPEHPDYARYQRMLAAKAKAAAPTATKAAAQAAAKGLPKPAASKKSKK